MEIMQNMKRELTPEEIHRVQQLELEMLIELDRVCQRHHINYVIWGGTMLGAIRHRGFIPWDGDADVSMLREDYENFKKVISELNPNICFFQDNTTDPNYRWGYGKLRRTGTRYVRLGQENLKCKDGIFIDIFPYDDIPLGLLLQMLQDFYCYCLRKITWSEVGRLQTSGLKKIWFTILSKIPIKWVYNRLKWIHKKSNNGTPNKVTCLMYTAIGKLYYKSPLKDRYGIPKKWILERELFQFEGIKLYGSKHYDEYLTYVFRDYMTPPPVEKRGEHLPVSYIEFPPLDISK